MLSPAKINLDLRITGRRDDGYHLLDSIVAFADFGDELAAFPADQLGLKIEGPFSSELEENEDNLVLKAARLLCEEAGVAPNISFRLTKNLPVSSGIGGGSSNAAAALKLTNKILKLNLSEGHLKQVALKIGADVPVCLDANITQMKGIGEELIPVNVALNQSVLLVNPGISVSTASIFSKFHQNHCEFSEERNLELNQINWPLMLDILKASTNDLQSTACELISEIKQVLNALTKLDGGVLSRMSGSGATCFVLFNDPELCRVAEQFLANQYKNWWVKAAVLR